MTLTESYILARFDALERRLAELTQRVYRLEGGQAAEPQTVATAWAAAAREMAENDRPLREADRCVSRPAVPETPEREAPATVAAQPLPSHRSTADWETLLGGNWLNKIGAFVLVVGIALALAYSFHHMGPAGRDAAGLAAGAAMLATGIFYERRPRYRTFARSLIGGGWATLYITVYAMQAIEAARVIRNPVLGALLLVGVAAGMIAHALRYRSQAAAGVAYFSAFAALAVTEVAPLALAALVPLAASLLYLARRFAWANLALFGLIATYVTCASRGDTGAPLWQAQAIFAIFWLLFEGFDLLQPQRWIMPLNAVGFLALSLAKWNTADAAHVWAFLAVAAAAYAVNAAWRARFHPEAEPLAGGWHVAATAAAALGAAAMFKRFDHQALLFALAAEAELLYLCGWRLGARYLRLLAAPLFAVFAIHLGLIETTALPVRGWAPAAVLGALLLYGNRALRPADTFYGYGAAALIALVAGFEAPPRECGRVWFVVAAGPFFVGWWRRLADLRFQGYLLACLGGFGTMVTAPHPPLSTAIGAAVSYAAALCALRSREDRFVEGEREALFNAASTAGALLLAIVLRAVLPQPDTGMAWAAEALLLAAAAAFAAGGAESPRGLKPALRALAIQSYLVAAAAFAGCWAGGLDSLPTGAAIGCFYAAQLLSARKGWPRVYYSVLGTALTTVLLYHQVSGSVLTVAWGIQGLMLLGAGFPLRDRALRLSGLGLLLFCILKLFLYDLGYLETLPRILSFIVLGLILVGVSWIYTRFRERVEEILRE